MKKQFKYILGILVVCCVILVGCSGIHQTLSGCYKTPDKAEDGTEQPNYWYFKKDGTLLYCTPQVDAQHNKDDDYYYGEAMRGTWKSLGDNKFLIKMHDVYDKDYYTVKAKLNGNKLHTYSNSKDSKYIWYADNSTKQTSMTYSDFIDMFNRAKESDQQCIQENGYTKPDNDSSDSSDTSGASVSDPKIVGILAYAKMRGGLNSMSGTLEYMLSPNGKYALGQGTKDGTIGYRISGDKVTCVDGSFNYSEDSAQTFSIKDLAKQYYSSADDKATVDDLASNVHVTDSRNQ